jgi:predicted nucleic acid-binding protein
VRALDALVVAAISRVEVPAALWRKHRMGELAADDARLLASAFAADATERFAVVALGGRVLELGARLVAVHPLRAYDAVQLAAALAARDADPDCDRFACFDGRLRDAAAAEGFALVP